MKLSLESFEGRQMYASYINQLVKMCYDCAFEHGWWEQQRTFGDVIALIHSEASEALEAFRLGNQDSEKIPGITGIAEEFADVIIRIFDYCGRNKLDIGTALVKKMLYNESRPYRHGGKAL